MNCCDGGRINMFDRKLYFEGLRRILVEGIAAALILFTVTALVPILTSPNDSKINNDYIYVIEAVEKADSASVTRIPFKSLKTNSDLAKPMYGLMLFSAVMAYSMFGFLFKRSACDMFHALPQKRRKVFFSFYLAWLSWVAVIAAVGALISAALWGAVHSLSIPAAVIFSEMGKILLSSMFCSSFFLVAMMIAGTRGTSIILALSGLVLIPVFCGILISALSYVPFININQPILQYLDPNNYLPLSFLDYGIVSIYQRVYHPLWMYIVDLVFALLMTALAGFLYCKRKSEIAGNMSPSKFTGIFIRTMIASVPTLAVGNFVLQIAEDRRYEKEGLVVFSAVALLIWFLYPLITTKNLKNMLKAVKTLWILPAIVLFMLGTFYGIRSIVYNDRFEADDVRSVTIEVRNYYSDSGENIILKYCDFVTIEETDDVEYLTDLYNQTLSWSKSNNGYKLYLTYNLKNGRKLYRTMTIVDSQTKRVGQMVLSDSEYIKAAISVNFESIVEIDVPNLAMHGKSLTEYGNVQVLGSFIDEYNKMTEDERLEFVRYSDVGNRTDARLVFTSKKDGISFTRLFCLNEKFTPETCALIERLKADRDYWN